MKTKKKKVESANAATKRQSTISFFPFAVVEQKALRMKRIGTHCKGGVDTDVVSIVTHKTNQISTSGCCFLLESIAPTPEGSWTHLFSLASKKKKKNQLNERWFRLKVRWAKLEQEESSGSSAHTISQFGQAQQLTLTCLHCRLQYIVRPELTLNLLPRCWRQCCHDIRELWKSYFTIALWTDRAQGLQGKIKRLQVCSNARQAGPFYEQGNY